MTYIDVPVGSELDEATGAQVERFAEEHGHFARLRDLWALFPAALGAVDNMYRLMIGEGRLERWQRELLFAASADARGDEYLSEALSSQVSDRRGLDRAMVAAMRRGEDAGELTRAERALVMFCRKAAVVPYKMVEQDVEKLHEVGWENADIVEALGAVCVSGYMGVLSQALDVQQDRG